MSDHPLKETTFAVATLGCKVNQADSEAIGEQLSAAGYVQRDFSDRADIYIVNTCTVTHLGDRSSRQLIAQAHRRHPDALLVVTGCYAELNPKAVAALPGVDIVIGNSGKETLIDAIRQQTKPLEIAQAMPMEETNSAARGIVLPILSLDRQHIGSDSELAPMVEAEAQPDNPARLSPFTDTTDSSETANSRLVSRTRVQMKEQDGCDNRCTYCIVQSVRGGSSSLYIGLVVGHLGSRVRVSAQEVGSTVCRLGQ